MSAQEWMADRVRSTANDVDYSHSMWDDDIFIWKYEVPRPTMLARIKGRIFGWWVS